MLVDAAKGIEDRTRKLFEVKEKKFCHFLWHVFYYCIVLFIDLSSQFILLLSTTPYHYSYSFLLLSSHLFFLFFVPLFIINEKVCRMRKLPIFSFANKMDRPSLTPYEIIDQVNIAVDWCLQNLVDWYLQKCVDWCPQNFVDWCVYKFRQKFIFKMVNKREKMVFRDILMRKFIIFVLQCLR